MAQSNNDMRYWSLIMVSLTAQLVVSSAIVGSKGHLFEFIYNGRAPIMFFIEELEKLW